MENAGCIRDLNVVVERCLGLLCILHCCMAMGRLQVAFSEDRLGDLPKDNAVAVHNVLFRARASAGWGPGLRLTKSSTGFVPHMGGNCATIGLSGGGR